MHTFYGICFAAIIGTAAVIYTLHSNIIEPVFPNEFSEVQQMRYDSIISQKTPTDCSTTEDVTIRYCFPDGSWTLTRPDWLSSNGSILLSPEEELEIGALESISNPLLYPWKDAVTIRTNNYGIWLFTIGLVLSFVYGGLPVVQSHLSNSPLSIIMFPAIICALMIITTRDVAVPARIMAALGIISGTSLVGALWLVWYTRYRTPDIEDGIVVE